MPYLKSPVSNKILKKQIFRKKKQQKHSKALKT